MIKQLIICHRGVDRSKENTLDSLLKVSTLSFLGISFGIEFDIQLTTSGQLVCYHDHDLLRIHNTDKKVVDLTVDDLIKYEIPTLDQIFDDIQHSPDIFLDVELKVFDEFDNRFLDTLIKLVKNRPNMINNMIITSFCGPLIESCLEKRINCGLILYDQFDSNYIKYLMGIGLSNLIIHKSQWNELIVNQLINHLNVYIYTLFDITGSIVDDDCDTEFIRLIKDHKIGLITDNYEKVISALSHSVDANVTSV
jgi:glycerophosphoryl diester phosphodiesterase